MSPFYYVPLLAASLLSLACNARPHYAEDYEKGLRHLLDHPSRMGYEARVIGRSGKTEVKERDFFYAGADGTVVQPSDLQTMDPGMRSLVVRKEILRRLVVEEGIQSGLYSSPDALNYVLPRLEKILEEYYYYKQGNYEATAAQLEKLAPDDEAMADLLKRDPKLARVGADMGDMRRQRALLIKKLVERKAEEQRQALITELLKKNAPFEVLP